MRLIIIALIIILPITLLAELQADKAAHFSGCLGSYVLIDCVCEWVNLPPYLPFLIVGTMAVAKEINDPFFNWKDIYADGAGIFVGFGIRFVDKKY